eukprot:3936316-Rhodomonas_salina.1
MLSYASFLKASLIKKDIQQITCEQNIIRIFDKNHPELTRRFSRLRVEPARVDRGSFILLWDQAQKHNRMCPLMAAKQLMAIWGEDFMSPDEIITLHKELITSESYKCLEQQWLASKSMPLSPFFMEWLMQPIFPERLLRDFSLRTGGIIAATKRKRKHEENVEMERPCTPTCGACGNQLHPRLAYIKKVEGKGKGLFAKSSIPKDTWISQYTGKRTRVRENDEQGDYFIEFRNGKEGIDGKKRNALAHFANSECFNPNSQLIESLDGKEINLWVARDIAPGEEITVNYGP